MAKMGKVYLADVQHTVLKYTLLSLSGSQGT